MYKFLCNFYKYNESSKKGDACMKKISISILCIIVALALIVGVTAVKVRGAADDVFLPDSSYINAENLAAGKGAHGFEKLTDGDFSTAYRSFSKSGVQIDLDLGQTYDFNALVLKEKGLNIKSFTVLVSEDGETFEPIYEGDKIEYHRLCTFDTVFARYIRLFIGEADRFISLREIEVYHIANTGRMDFRTTAYILNSDFTEFLEADAEEEQKRQMIYDYLENYRFSGVSNVNYYCGISFDENGNVLLSGTTENAEKSKADIAFVVNCMRECGREDLKITYVIGMGTGNPQNNPAMAEHKDDLITNLISLANEIGFDGIDIDYEFPQSDYDYEVFGNFLVDLKARMDQEMNVGTENILSCAFGTRDIDYPGEVVDSIDIVNMMTYDIFDQDGQHSSFWSCAVQGVAYLESVGFSKEQINIGIPFYGTQTDALMEQYIYNNIRDYDYYRNEYTFNSYLNGEPTEVYFNSPALVRDKTAYAVLSGCGGVMVWHFSCDTDYSSPYSLWRAVYDSVSQFGGAA